MELSKIFQTIWKRLWLILLGTTLCALLVFALSTVMQPIYQAQVTMMVSQSTNTPLDYAPVLTGQDLAMTYTELLTTRPLLELVISNLGLSLSPDDLIEDMVDATLIPETQLLELTVDDTDPRRASDIANEIALTFIYMHNAEQQLESIVALEHDVVAQMSALEQLIRREQSANTQSPTSGRLTEEEANLRQATLSQQQLTYASLLQTYLNVRLTQAQLLDVTVVEPAIPPDEPIRPNVLLYTFVGTFAGLVFTVGLAFLVEFLDRTFEDSEDIRRILGLPTLGTIPRLSRRESRSTLLVADHPHSLAAEAYRTLRTNIRFASVDRPLTTLLITSPGAGEGKTTVAANLAVICAHTGLRVLLVDTDLRFPNLHHLFGLENTMGLTDLLIGDVQDLQQCILETGIENLYLFPSGSIPPNPSELLGSKRLHDLLPEIQERADLIILDTPPLLAVSDALILASKADALLLLLDRQHTSHQAAHRACEVIKSVGAVLIGTVLTKARVRARDSAYYYYAARARRGRGKTPAWIIRLKRLFSFRRLRRRVKLGSTSRRPESENVELGV